jgi:periplasmic divalent cation tolerance protein
MIDARIVLTTAASSNEAEKIAGALVERRLAACVNIIPQIQSVYRWEGKVERATEWLLLIKTRAEVFARLRETINELHSYEVPECIMLKIGDGAEPYLRWIAENTV